MSATFEDLRDNIIGAIEGTGAAIEAVSKLQSDLVAEQQRLWADNAALRDELHALANRVESLTRVTVTPHGVAWEEK